MSTTQLTAQEIELASLRTALNAAILALDDWTTTVAPVFCDKDRVAEARARLNANGTLWYIATTLETCRNALTHESVNGTLS